MPSMYGHDLAADHGGALRANRPGGFPVGAPAPGRQGIAAMLGSFTYRHSPVWAQESLLAAKSSLRNIMREGAAFGTFTAQIDQSQWWPESRLREFQAQRLRALVESAVRHVPYYREKYRSLGLDIGKLSFPEGMEQLPIMTKNDVREAGQTLLTANRRGPLFSGGTSGTTGAPLELCQDLYAINRENAFIRRQLAWAGMRPGDRRAWLRGDMIVPAGQDKPPYWRLNRAENMLMLSSYHLSETAAVDYVDALAAYEPVVIQAYPSSIGFLAKWMLASGRRHRCGSLRGIVTSSETLTEEVRRNIEEAFGCKVFDWYGQFERVAAIGTCEHGRYHLLTDYSHVEMLPAGDGLFELVGTGFNNFAMPLIRYRCEDLVRPATAAESCPCGRSLPLIAQVFGRVDDPIKLPGGRSVGRLDHIFKGVEGVLEAQIRQDQIDRVTICVVPSAGYDERTHLTLLSNARQRLGDKIALEVKLVKAIARTGNGKFKGVVCNL